MKKYRNDYRQSGKEFEYTGKWHGTEMSVEELEKYGYLYTGLMTGVLLIYIASLMLNNAGSRVFWILIPHMGLWEVYPLSFFAKKGIREKNPR